MLTPENTAAIRERAEKATAGPWKFEDEHELKGATNTQIYSEPCADHEQNDRDKDFIAHSRTDIPALLAHVEELEAKHAVTWKAYTEACQQIVLLKDRLGETPEPTHFFQAREFPHPSPMSDDEEDHV